MPKAAVVLLADTTTAEAMGRMVNAFTTAKEFTEAGDEARIIFDGAGTVDRGAAERRPQVPPAPGVR